MSWIDIIPLRCPSYSHFLQRSLCDPFRASLIEDKLGRADAIVTGDRVLLALREYRGVRIISLREYLGDT